MFPLNTNFTFLHFIVLVLWQFSPMCMSKQTHSNLVYLHTFL